MRRFQNACLGAAVVLAVLTLVVGGIVMGQATAGQTGLERWVNVAFDTLGLLSLSTPKPEPSGVLYQLARGFAAGFVATLSLGVTGVFLTLYQPARDALIRLRIWATLAEPTVVIGLGWIGAPLVAEIRHRHTARWLKGEPWWWTRDRWVFSSAVRWGVRQVRRVVRVVWGPERRPVIAVALRDEGPLVEAARRAGALVLVGDATDAALRRKLMLPRAREVFIATGSDALNVEIAGDLLDDASFGQLKPHNQAHPLRCYVHIDDPTQYATFQDHGLFQRRNDALDLHAFSTRETAARQLLFTLRDETQRANPGHAPKQVALARTGGCVPGTGEVLHVFVFGFGALGQTVALQTARLVHVANAPESVGRTALSTSPCGLRSRLSLIDYFDDAVVGRARSAFMERYPRFSHPGSAGRGLDLTTRAFREHGDAWTWRPSVQRTDILEAGHLAWVQKEKHPPTRPKSVRTTAPPYSARTYAYNEVTPITYATSAEYYSLTGIVEAHEHIDALVARLRTEVGPRVRPAIVLCFSDDERNVEAALRLRTALSAALPPADETLLAEQVFATTRAQGGSASFDGFATVCPIYVYLPIEEGLEALVNPPPFSEPEGTGSAERWTRTPQQIEGERFPIYPFGQRRHAACYDAITLGGERELALHIADSYAVLSGRPAAHPDFNISNLEAALHAMLKLDALDLCQVQGYQPPSDPKWSRRPLLRSLLREYVFEDEQELNPRLKDVHDPVEPIVLTLEGFKTRSEALRERLAIRNLVKPASALNEADRQKLEEALKEASRAAVKRFRGELATLGHDLDVIAEMEHNRWMGERLCRGWSFGERCDRRKHRATFIPWAQLSEDDQEYDRVQLLRHILLLDEKRVRVYPRCPYAALWKLLQDHLGAFGFRRLVRPRASAATPEIADFVCPSANLVVGLTFPCELGYPDLPLNPLLERYNRRYDPHRLSVASNEVFTHPEAVLARVRALLPDEPPA